MVKPEKVKGEVVEEQEKKKKDKSDFWWWVALGGVTAAWIFSKGSRYGYKRACQDVEGGLQIMFNEDPTFKESMVNTFTECQRKRLMKMK